MQVGEETKARKMGTMLSKKNLVFPPFSFGAVKWGKTKKGVEFISRKVGGEEDGTLHASNGIKIESL